MLDGMREAFLSSIWTLTFRELGRLEKANESPPAPLAPPS